MAIRCFRADWELTMSICTCEWRPRCQYHHCSKFAEWSIITPPGRWLKERPYGFCKFYCTGCKDYYLAALSKPLKGIDRPPGADEEWRPSIMEHIRHARIAISFEERKKKPPPETSYAAGDQDWYWRWLKQSRGLSDGQVAQLRQSRLTVTK